MRKGVLIVMGALVCALASRGLEVSAAGFSDASISGSLVCVGSGYGQVKDDKGATSWLPSAEVVLVTSDGKGKFTGGKNTINVAGLACSYTLTEGSYSTNADGTGTSTVNWKGEPSNSSKCAASAKGTSNSVLQNGTTVYVVGTGSDGTGWLVCNKQSSQ
jgi:hypothetical protein